MCISKSDIYTYWPYEPHSSKKINRYDYISINNPLEHVSVLQAMTTIFHCWFIKTLTTVYNKWHFLLVVSQIPTYLCIVPLIQSINTILLLLIPYWLYWWWLSQKISQVIILFGLCNDILGSKGIDFSSVTFLWP